MHIICKVKHATTIRRGGEVLPPFIYELALYADL
jgi:membrane carboxypeptidase/penicillin-binding protein PbpC